MNKVTIVALITIWLLLLFWYTCFIFFSPTNVLYNMSPKTEESQKIQPNSILNIVYIRKSVTPKLKIIAIETIILWIASIVMTSVIITLWSLGVNEKTIATVVTSYAFTVLFMMIITIAVLSLKK